MEDVKEKKSIKKLIKLLAVSVGHFMNDFYMTLIPPILFLFTDALSLNLTQQGLIASAITISGSFAQPVIGHIVDKRGKPWLLILSVVWITFFMSISGVIKNFYLLMIVLSLGALASALYHPLGSALAVSLTPKSKGTSLSIFMTIGGFAASVSPIVSIPIVTKYGLEKLIYFMIPGFIVAGIMYLSQLHKMEFESSKAKGKKYKTKLDFFTLKWLSAFVYLGTVRTLVRRAILVFGVQLLLLKHVDLKMASITLSLYLLVTPAGTMAGGYLSDRVGNKKVFIGSMLLITIGVGMMIWGSTVIMMIGCLLVGFCLGGSNTVNVVLTQDLIPKNLNLATGLIMGLAGGIGGLGILLYGKLADSHGLIFATTLCLIPLVLGNILTILIPNSQRR